jgi:hypothetical protein
MTGPGDAEGRGASGARGANLSAVLGAWTAMMASGGAAELAAILDDAVVWQGLRPELVCRGREHVLDLLVRNRGRPPRITRIELEEFGDRVAVCVEGLDFTGPIGSDGEPLLPPGAPRSLVLSMREGRVARMDSFPSREAAWARARG